MTREEWLTKHCALCGESIRDGEQHVAGPGRACRRVVVEATEVLSSSRGFGRMFARITVGRGPVVLATALRKARAQFPACDADAFVQGFQDERRLMSAR